MAALVEFRAVAYRIGNRAILDNINLRIEPGDAIVVLGRSGSGKTTLLRLVNALIFPTSGEVLFDGKSTREWDPIRLRRRIGYVIQEVGLFPHFTVARNVGVAPRLERWPPEAVKTRVTKLLEEVGLPAEQFGPRFPHQLSGGQRQRVGIARALAADPPLMLLDEPFGALDPITRLDLQDQFISLRNSTAKTILFVTHDVREALRIGTRIVLLDGGRIDTIAAPQDFVKAPSPEARAFLNCLEMR
jgi:osmoprotectant transport system ATP-binding protein